MSTGTGMILALFRATLPAERALASLTGAVGGACRAKSILATQRKSVQPAPVDFTSMDLEG
eukprot:6197599-Pleurochrysis_carterae.AAC.1